MGLSKNLKKKKQINGRRFKMVEEQLTQLPFAEMQRKRINKKEARDKQLIKEEDYTNYQLVESLYRKVFETYLKTIYPFYQIDQKLEESPLGYTMVETENRNLYHRTSYLDSNYIFLKNFYYVERLNEEQIHAFLEFLKDQNESRFHRLLEIVKETFPDIVSEKSTTANGPTNVFYGPPVPGFSFSNQTLVFLLNYGKNKIPLEEQDFVSNKQQKEDYANELMQSLKNTISMQLDYPVEVRCYKGNIQYEGENV